MKHSPNVGIIINDLPTISNIFNSLMDADDTTLFCNFDNIRNTNITNDEIVMLQQIIRKCQ